MSKTYREWPCPLECSLFNLCNFDDPCCWYILLHPFIYTFNLLLLEFILFKVLYLKSIICDMFLFTMLFSARDVHDIWKTRKRNFMRCKSTDSSGTTVRSVCSKFTRLLLLLVRPVLYFCCTPFICDLNFPRTSLAKESSSLPNPHSSAQLSRPTFMYLKFRLQ